MTEERMGGKERKGKIKLTGSTGHGGNGVHV